MSEEPSSANESTDQLLWSEARKFLRRLLDFELGSENLTIYDSDIFLVSYPKSGNTWLRFLLGNIKDPDTPVDFRNLESRVPDIYTNRDRKLRRISRPRILKSHEPFTSTYPSVIYLVRDPRDVAVSYYHHHRKFNLVSRDYPLSEFFERFLNGELDPYGEWGSHVGGWMESGPGSSNFHFLRFEDFKRAPLAELTRIAQFLKIDCAPEELKQAVALSSLERMQKLESAQWRHWKSTKGTAGDLPFIRTGKTGTWENELPDHLARKLQQRWAEQMRLAGYD